MKLIIDIPNTAYEAYKEWHKQGVSNVEQSLIALAMPYEERPHGECQNCQYLKFTEQFVDGVVEVMNKNGIKSVEELQKMLQADMRKGG